MSRRRDKSLERLTKIVGNGVLAIKDYRKWLDHPKVKQQLEESKKLKIEDIYTEENLQKLHMKIEDIYTEENLQKVLKEANKPGLSYAEIHADAIWLEGYRKHKAAEDSGRVEVVSEDLQN